MYNISQNVNRINRELEVKVGLHQGSTLSPLLFIIIMDVISQEVGRGPPHAMLFSDDLVLCDNTRKQRANLKNILNLNKRGVLTFPWFILTAEV